jgi:hypothetical protein
MIPPAETAIVSVRLSRKTLAQIDEIVERDDLLTRAEVLRQIINRGITALKSKALAPQEIAL